MIQSKNKRSKYEKNELPENNDEQSTSSKKIETTGNQLWSVHFGIYV